MLSYTTSRPACRVRCAAQPDGDGRRRCCSGAVAVRMGAGRWLGAERGLFSCGLRALMLWCAFLVVCVGALGTPVAARAASIEMPRVAIEAVVRENGDLEVTERRSFTFEDDVNGVYWTIPLAQNAQGATSSFTIDGVVETDADGTERAFSQVDYAQEGDAGVYTAVADSTEVEVKLYTPHEDGDEATVAFSYTLTGAVMAWADTGELYWQFVGPAWEEDSYDVSLLVRFPLADRASSVPVVGEDFRAWGHGPLEATVTLDADAATVAYTVPCVRSGEYAEARVAFPLSWVPVLAASSGASSEERMAQILEEEDAWAADANARREQARRLISIASVVQVAVPAVLLAVVAGLRFTRGRRVKPQFAEAYCSEIPSADHPAVIAAFMQDGTVDERAFVSTLMKLTDDGVVELSLGHGSERGLFGTKETEEYRMRLVRESGALDAIDRAALDLFFGQGAPAGTTRTFMELRREAEDDPKAYHERLARFKDEVSAALAARGLIEESGAKLRTASLAVGLGTLVISVVLLFVTDMATLAPFGIGLVLLAISTVLAFTYRRYTREGVELRAQLEALKHWLEDFTSLDAAVPEDIASWNRMLVIAVALGVSDAVLRDLANAVPPHVRGAEETGYYYPVYWWCFPHGALFAPAHEMSGAYEASAGSVAAGLDSSGGGLGGGFSAGGGGGVGGGGGGSF